MIDLPPPDVFTAPRPAYVRRDSGLIVPRKEPISAALPGFVPGLGFLAGGVPPFDFLGQVHSGSSLTTYTFADFNFGAPHPARKIVLGIKSNQNSGARAINSASVGGVAALSVVNTDPSIWLPIGIWIADVPSGNAGALSVTFSAGMNSCTVAAWAVYDIASSTPFDTAVGANAPTMAGNVDVPANGYVFAYTYNPVGTGPTWTGVTTTEGIADLTAGVRASAASAAGLAAETNRTVTAAWGSNNNNSRMAVASFSRA